MLLKVDFSQETVFISTAIFVLLFIVGWKTLWKRSVFHRACGDCFLPLLDWSDLCERCTFRSIGSGRRRCLTPTWRARFPSWNLSARFGLLFITEKSHTWPSFANELPMLLRYCIDCVLRHPNGRIQVLDGSREISAKFQSPNLSIPCFRTIDLYQFWWALEFCAL